MLKKKNKLFNIIVVLDVPCVGPNDGEVAAVVSLAATGEVVVISSFTGIAVVFLDELVIVEVVLLFPLWKLVWLLLIELLL